MAKKDFHVFGWDDEPADERPSEFVPSTGYGSSLSGYYHSTLDPAFESRRKRRPQSSGGGWQFLLVILGLLCLGGYLIYRFAHVHHG